MSIVATLAAMTGGAALLLQILAAAGVAVLLALGYGQRALDSMRGGAHDIDALPGRLTEGVLGLLAIGVPLAWLATLIR